MNTGKNIKDRRVSKIEGLAFFGGMYVFLTPPTLIMVPEAQFNVLGIYSLSSLSFNRVTRVSTIKIKFPSPLLPQVHEGATGAWSAPIIRMSTLTVFIPSRPGWWHCYQKFYNFCQKNMTCRQGCLISSSRVGNYHFRSFYSSNQREIENHFVSFLQPHLLHLFWLELSILVIFHCFF